MKRKIKRNALSRGTAVHLGGARVRFIWACGCTRVETVKTPAGPLGADGVARLVKNWRANGCVLEQCRKHPDYYSKVSVLAQLNAKHPQPVAGAAVPLDFSKVYYLLGIHTSTGPGLKFYVHAADCRLIKNAGGRTFADALDPCESPYEAAARFTMDHELIERGYPKALVCKCAKG